MTSPAFVSITDPAELHARQTATHSRAKRGARATAIDALEDCGVTVMAEALKLDTPSEHEVVYLAARRYLTERLRTDTDRTPHHIAGLRTALEAVGLALAWNLVDEEA